MSYLEKIVEQVDTFAKCENSLFDKYEFWKVQHVNIAFNSMFPPWKEMTKEDAREAILKSIGEVLKYNYQADSLKRNYQIRLPQETIDFKDVESINKYLPEDHIYLFGSSYHGKFIFLIGKKEEETTFRIKNTTIPTIIIGEELVNNHSLTAAGFYASETKNIIGRKEAGLYVMWDRINTLKKKGRSFGEVLYLHALKKLTNLSEKDILNTPRKNINKIVEEVVDSQLKHNILPHEKGHVINLENSPEFEIAKWMVMCKKNIQAWDFIHKVDDTIADSIELEGIKGRIPSIISLEEPTLSSMFSMYLGNIYINEQKELLSILERDLIEGFHDYIQTGDRNVIEEANQRNLERAVELRNKMHKMYEKKKLKVKSVLKLRKKVEMEARKELPKIKKAMKEIEIKISEIK